MISLCINTCCLEEGYPARSNAGQLHKQRAYALRNFILPQYIADPYIDEIVVVGSFEEGDGFTYINSPSEHRTWRDCLKHRLPVRQDPRTLSHLCAGWKRFYAHATEGFRELAETIREERRQAEEQMRARRRAQVPSGAVDRNAPCPCGSGRKFKKCCGR